MILRSMGYTNVRLKTETRDRLKKQGSKGESYDDVVARLLDVAETKAGEDEIY